MNGRAADIRSDLADLATVAGRCTSALRALTEDDREALQRHIEALPDGGPQPPLAAFPAMPFVEVLTDIATAARAASVEVDSPRLAVVGAVCEAAATVAGSMSVRTLAAMALLAQFKTSEAGLLGFADGLARGARTAADALSRPILH